MSRFTPGELAVMRILWEHGELKPSEIQQHFPEPIKNPALRSYLGILVDKGHVSRRKAGKEAPFRWKRNGLRHSFCSYRLAVLKNAHEVSLEAGNSPNMIFKHYRELVGPEDAQAWFSTSPIQDASNILPLRKSA